PEDCAADHKALNLNLEQAQKSDEVLIAAIAAGDESSLALLYDQYSSILFGLLLRILHSRADAEDVLQEVFVQVWQRAGDFDARRGRLFTWLVTMTRSRAIDKLRSLGTRVRTAQEAMRQTEDLWLGINSSNDTDKLLDRSEQRGVINRLLAEIPSDQRITLVLAYFKELSQSEIAELLGEPLGTVKTRMRSGLIKLREIVKDSHWQKRYQRKK
ncbi:MAG: sigma-70 family RNA polymerase sigma factor, partial [Pyrinomonadaceae bacterium]